MDYLILTSILIVIAIIVALFVFVKGWKAWALSSLAIVLAMSIGTYFLYADVMDIKENIMIKNKLIVLKDKDLAVTAFSFSTLENIGPDSIKPFTSEELKIVDKAIKSDDFSELEKTYYKIVVFDYTMFKDSLEDGIKYSTDGNTLEVSEEEVNQILKSENPLEIIFAKIAAIKQVDVNALPPELKQKAMQDFMKTVQITSPEQFKSYVFGMIIADKVQTKGPEAVVSIIKSDDLTIYPKTAVVRTLDMIPESLLLMVVQKMATPQKEA